MMKHRCLVLGFMSLLACSGGIAPIQVGLDDCASQGGCQADEFCAEGFCFAQRCVVNGKLEPGEACDDGNASELDGCSNQCTRARCGDGLVRQDKNPGTAGYEACDDGNENNADACTNDCRLPNCGDGFVAEGEGEACDDGNLENADACLNDCSLARCGDGILREGLALGDVGFEACDDGDDIDENACTAACRVARCGDGIRRTDQPVGTNDFEACDDGNDDETDACLSDCREASCGDGVLRTDQEPGDESYEACDDGNDEELDDCTSACERPRCGDGFENGRPGAEEACDDGDEDNGDACLNDCTRARCGDGFRRGDLALDHPGYEACDDGNAIETDLCLSGCQLNRCGDGHVLVGNESCDDGNDDQTDGCLNDCSLARCGDGFVREGEEACDDGNDVDTDGCRNDCRLSRCGDGVLRTDLVTMSSPGFEACEPDLDDHNGRCRSDCLLGRPPRILVAGDRHNCVLRSGRVWCWGDVLNRPDQGNGFIDYGPLEWLGDFGELVGFGHAEDLYTCLLGRSGRGMCHQVRYYEYYLGPSWPVPLMDLSPRRQQGQQCLLDVEGHVACLSGASPHPQALDLEGVIAISINQGLACAVTLGGQVYCWSEEQPEPVLVDDEGTAVAVELAKDRARLTAEGELSGIAYVLRADGRLEALPPDMPAVTGIDGPVKRVSFNGYTSVTGGEDACAVTVDGALFCTGETLLPSAEHRRTMPSEFIEIPLEEAAIDVAVGASKGNVVLSSGTVLSWGFLEELDGEYMRPLSLDRFQRTPVPVLGLPDPEAP